MRRKVLVIGGAGFIGRHVSRALLSADFDVVVLDTVSAADIAGVTWVAGSATDEDLLGRLVQARDCVVYLAGGSLPASANTDMAREIETNLRATVRTAEICAHAGVATFVFASSGGTVYGASAAKRIGEQHPTSPLNAYGVSKLASEHYLRLVSVMTGLTVVTLRMSNPYGEGQRATQGQGIVAAAMAAAYAQAVLPCWGDGGVVRDFVHIQDVADAFVAACGYSGPTVTLNIGAGRGQSILKVIAAVERATRRKITVDFQLHRLIDAPRNVLAIRRAAEVLGWTPKITFAEGLARTARWWRSEAASTAPNRPDTNLA